MIDNIDENLISDISYTNKDFRTIYPELLNLVKNLTNKWDPKASNESDPGVLLLKLNAIIADKNNYNIDKNILECFPLSVTQEDNARKLYDLSGYTMHWYKSATADIKFQLLKDNITYTLPQWTQISNSTGDIPYTTLRSLTLTSKLDNVNPVIIDSVPCIQGSVMDYTINGESLITLNNLDSELKLYFDSALVAENGIFIINSTGIQNEIWSDDTLWTKVDNLAAYSSTDKVYQFGILPNKNTCYIQFPEGLNALIDKGLKIKYTLGNGAAGNVKANSIDTFTQDLKSDNNTTSINNNLRISQTNSITNGADPETINEAYKNYKKTIGTFNTLVTIRDYENYIYNLVDNETRKNLVSNLVVSDRNNDINYSTNIQTWTPGLNKKELVVDLDTNNPLIPKLTAYDITLYLLNPEESLSYSPKVDDPFKPYNNTFLPLTNRLNTLDIEESISKSKSIVHNIKYPANNSSWFTFNNLYIIKGTLVTRYKVTKNEAAEIESKVITALFNKYNSRENQFGKAIDYDDLIKTIETADDRIRYLVLNRTEYDITKKLYDLQPSQSLTADDKQTIISKMILNGNCQLFKFDDNFQLEFGQNTNGDYGVLPTNNNLAIKSITSESTINLINNIEKEIPINTNVQVYHESLINTLVFSSYVYYTSNVLVEANQYTKLSGTDQISIRYTENNITKNYILKNTIIKSSISISNDNQEHQLLSNQTIGEYEINTTTLPIKTQYYFLLNNPDNRLLLNAGDSKILQENEYFIYTNPQSTDLIILGSGTKLELTASSSSINISLPRISIEDNSIDKVNWPTLEVNQTLNTTELTIIAIGEGINIKYEGSDLEISNEAAELTINDSYSFVYGNEPIDTGDDLDNNLEILPDGLHWYIQSRLNINANLIIPQQLVSDQSFTFIYTDNTSTTINGDDITPVNILFNNPIALTGGSDIDVKVLQDDGTSRYSLRAYSYIADNLPTGVKREVNGIINISDTKTLPYNFTATNNDTNSYLIPIYITKGINDTIDIYTDTDVPLNIFGTNSTSINTNLINGHSYILQIPIDNNNHTNLTIVITGTNSSVQVGYINKVLNYNDIELGIVDDVDCIYDNIKTKIQSLDTNNIFNWVYRVIEIDKVLSPLNAESFFNSNHIYNKYTIPQISFGENKTSITVNQSSIS